MTHDNFLPPHMVRELEYLGVLNRMPKYTKLKPDFERREDMAFNMPDLDEYGEPNF